MQIALLDWYRKNARDLPWRRFWSMHKDPYHVWLSEIMLQQTLIAVVVPRYFEVVEKYPNLLKFAEAPESDVRQIFRGLGYYRRFRFFHQACQSIAAKSINGLVKLPTSYREWLEVPGVGPYVAAAVSSITLNEAQAVLDGNVERVLCRLKGLKVVPNLPASKRALKKIADHLLNTENPGCHNQALMELGQRICTPSSPKCGKCPLSIHCVAFNENSLQDCPLPKARPIQRDVELGIIVKTNNKGFLGIRTRPAKAHFLAAAEGFPTLVKDTDGVWKMDDQKRNFSDSIKSGTSSPSDKTPAPYKGLMYLGSCKHSITHHRIRLHVWHDGSGVKKSSAEIEDWLHPKEVEARLISNLDRKAFALFSKESKARH